MSVTEQIAQLELLLRIYHEREEDDGDGRLYSKTI